VRESKGDKQIPFGDDNKEAKQKQISFGDGN